MALITIQSMMKFWPRADPAIRQSVVDGWQWFEAAGITTKLAVTHFMAQVSHECGAGTEMVENLNYRAEQLVRQWPSHFTPEQAAEMAHDQRAIANQAYNGRMGNRVGTNDGWDYRGRGASQTTGRDAYAKLSKTTGLDLLNNPDWLNDPRYFTRIACYDFVQCGCLPYTVATASKPKGDITMVTKRLNGGLIGFDQRKVWFAKWEAALANQTEAPILQTPQEFTDDDFMVIGEKIPGSIGPTSVGGPNGPTPLVP